jgi:hypothetical protein
VVCCQWCFLSFFSSFLSPPLKKCVDHSKFQSCSLIYWDFNFGPYFFILIFVLGLFVKF